MMRAVSERFGTNLLAAREVAGLSQEELSFLSGLHRTEIGQLERGARVPRIDSLAKLCGALEVEYAVLMAGIYWTPPPTLRGGGFEVARASQLSRSRGSQKTKTKKQEVKAHEEGEKEERSRARPMADQEAKKEGQRAREKTKAKELDTLRTLRCRAWAAAS